jgi:hypothetical protein
MINFKTGGELVSSETMHAHAGRGISGQGLYDAVLVEGEVVISKELYRTLVEIYQEDKFIHLGSATHFKHVSYGQGMVVKTIYNNCVLHQLPKIVISEHGAEAVMSLAFSLSDPEQVGVE